MSSGRRRAKPARRAGKAGRKRGPFGGPWLFACGLALLLLAGLYEGPKVAREVVHVLDLRRVESRADVLLEAAAESGLDAHFLGGVMYVESSGRVDAVSKVGALGLFQLMPAAAGDAAQRLKLPPPTREALLSDARLNARLGANHLKQLQRSLGPDLERVLVAYNAGRGRLLEWEKAAGGWSAWRELHARRGDSETLRYAQKVLAAAERLRERGALRAAAEARTPVTARLSSELEVGPTSAPALPAPAGTEPAGEPAPAPDDPRRPERP